MQQTADNAGAGLQLLINTSIQKGGIIDSSQSVIALQESLNYLLSKAKAQEQAEAEAGKAGPKI